VQLGILLYVVLVQSGLMSKPQQICGEETCYHPGKNQVLISLHGFATTAIMASWLTSGQRVRKSIS